MTALFDYVTALLEYFDFLLSKIGQVKFSHDPFTNGYSLGVPLGFHRLHRNAYVYVIVGMTSFIREKNDEKLPGGFLREFSRNKAIDRP